ncbi:putative Zinc-ribbon domain [Trypanosoma melophagium]|uniref:putative Zinc-ribbon domain n=1 Tax=Trypanosoma melophagium TaxID=715481 RepID=UPI00351A878C|nr:putative Zinc-ribbon domain [Trypanosoma melophagium]
MRRALIRRLFTTELTISTTTTTGRGRITASRTPLFCCGDVALCMIVRGAATSVNSLKNGKQIKQNRRSKTEGKENNEDFSMEAKEKTHNRGKRTKRTQRNIQEENEKDSMGMFTEESGNYIDESVGIWREEEQSERMSSNMLDGNNDEDSEVVLNHHHHHHRRRSSLKEGELEEEDGDGENDDRPSGSSSTGEGMIPLQEEESRLLIDRFPDLAAEYDTKANKQPVNEVLVDSACVVWWKCLECEFRWESGIFVRTCLRTKCQQCEKRRNPCLGSRLVQLWDHSLNDPCIDPKTVTRSSNKSAYWRCPTCSTSFQARIKDMVAEKAKCPSCSLLNLHADFSKDENGLLQEWHPLKNGDLKPSQVKLTDQTKLWWLCMACGHEWEATLAVRLNKSRRAKGRECPVCLGKGKE